MELRISKKPAVISGSTPGSDSAVAPSARRRRGPVAGLCWLGAACLGVLGCGSLFGTNTPQPTPTTASISPAVSFPSGLDCSNAGAQPISASWDVKPIQLDSGTVGATTEFANQELLANSGGSPTDCYYTPSGAASSIAGVSLRPGLWQITLTHTIPGYPNPIVCTRQLVRGVNQIAFIVSALTVGCQ